MCTYLEEIRHRINTSPLLVLALTLIATGCSGPSTIARVPAPDLQLIESGSLSLPADCEPRAGEVYRAEFEVGPDGHVQNVRTNGTANCAQQALAAWVSTFRYNSRQSSVETVVDWMLVEARRGG